MVPSIINFPQWNLSGHTSSKTNCFSFSRSTIHFFDKAFLDQCGGRLSSELVGRLVTFFSGQHFWSENVKTVCRIKIHSARGLAMGVWTRIPSWLHMGYTRWGGPAPQKSPRRCSSCSTNRAEQAETTWRSRKSSHLGKISCPPWYDSCNWLGLDSLDL
jgi:hypothetical protein